MRTFKLTIAYDGTAYAGWQVQQGRATVQGVLEGAVERVTGQRVRVLASGRTDTGVHALGQVVGLRVDTHLAPEVLRRALNANLPHDIAVLEVAGAHEGFHPIRDVLRKRYGYVIHDAPVRDVFHRHYCWHYARGRLDAEAMDRAAEALTGRHEFSSFETSGAKRSSSVRTIYDIGVRRGRAGQGGWIGAWTQSRAREVDRAGTCEQGRAGQGDFVVVEVEADGFLYNMVRAIVGTLVEVGRGAEADTWPGEVLHAADRSAAGPTAPPQGLFLLRVEYHA